jgi:hypothetical protein
MYSSDTEREPPDGDTLIALCVCRREAQPQQQQSCLKMSSEELHSAVTASTTVVVSTCCTRCQHNTVSSSTKPWYRSTKPLAVQEHHAVKQDLATSASNL